MYCPQGQRGTHSPQFVAFSAQDALVQQRLLDQVLIQESESCLHSHCEMAGNHTERT